MASVEELCLSKLTIDAVEILVEKGITSIPEKFIRPPEERFTSPTPSEDVEEQVPVIDLEGLNCCEGSIEREKVLKQLAYACENWGFFQIVNHGIPESLMEAMMNVGKAFFALSVEEKQAYAALPGLIMQGYGSKYIAREGATRDWRDYIYLLLQPHSIRDYDYWPSDPSDFREVVHNYSEEALKLAKRLMGAFSLNLGLPQNYLETFIVQPYQNMLINYYPPCPEPELTAGFYAHSDIGMATLLLQETGSKALQIRKIDKWVPVVAASGALLVNIADQVEIISNGRYKSIEHRVVADKDKPRISIPVFCDAAPHAIIKPAPELLESRMNDEAAKVEEMKENPNYSTIVFKNHEIAFYTDGANSKKYVQSYMVQA
ncbi:jasmonate-induced oxygenase 2 [Cryptomeria japonica]|uniref:jasmonate-induced oxygenase 2 n=1 Tax=Cryptomeria japonica TaxID=3369 RepID=UPI0025AC0F62|nr:jasmonate-induced oxygenase 2 [Cryptomeria japonica]